MTQGVALSRCLAAGQREDLRIAEQVGNASSAGGEAVVVVVLVEGVVVVEVEVGVAVVLVGLRQARGWR